MSPTSYQTAPPRNGCTSCVQEITISTAPLVGKQNLGCVHISTILFSALLGGLEVSLGADVHAPRGCVHRADTRPHKNCRSEACRRVRTTQRSVHIPKWCAHRLGACTSPGNAAPGVSRREQPAPRIRPHPTPKARPRPLRATLRCPTHAPANQAEKGFP